MGLAICIPIIQAIKFFRCKNIKPMNNLLTDHRVDDMETQIVIVHLNTNNLF